MSKTVTISRSAITSSIRPTAWARWSGVETQEVAGLALEVYVITFDHEKMTLRVPTKKAKTRRPARAGRGQRGRPRP